MRLRNDPNAINVLKESDLLITNFPYVLNENHILEIGCGKGDMLTQMALKDQNKIFIGIEKYPTIALKALKKAIKLDLKNFFLICDDVNNLKDKISGQVGEIWLTFSDPWPKKRHFKRRLTYKDFLLFYKTLLIPKKGVLKIKSDNDSFFNWSIEEINEFGGKIIFITNDLHSSIKNSDNVQSEYEKKWSSKGKNINYMEVIFE